MESHTPSHLACHKGSILGPLLFNVYINSLPNAVKKTRMILCADDVLFCDASTRQELQIAAEFKGTGNKKYYEGARELEKWQSEISPEYLR